MRRDGDVGRFRLAAGGADRRWLVVPTTPIQPGARVLGVFRILAASFRGVAHGTGQQLLWCRQPLGDDGAVGFQSRRFGDSLWILLIELLKVGFGGLLLLTADICGESEWCPVLFF